jgi:hypothetical protein
MRGLGSGTPCPAPHLELTLKSGAAPVKATSHSSTATHRGKQHRPDCYFSRMASITPTSLGSGRRHRQAPKNNQTRKVSIFFPVADVAPRETLILAQRLRRCRVRSAPCFAWRASRRMAARPMVRDGAEEAPPHHEVPAWSRHEFVSSSRVGLTAPAGACHRAGRRPDPVGRPDDRLRPVLNSQQEPRADQWPPWLFIVASCSAVAEPWCIAFQVS